MAPLIEEHREEILEHMRECMERVAECTNIEPKDGRHE
jgi:hypothetical protein